MQNAADFLNPFLVTSLIAVTSVTGISGCATSSSGAEAEEHLITQIIPSAIRIRRPNFESYHPEKSPLRSARTLGVQDPLDCQTLESLFGSIVIPEVRTCLNSLSQPYEARYRFRRETQPYLELRDPHEAPICLREQLPRIDLPREVVFQKAVSGKAFQECYTSRLDIEANRFLGVPLPIHRYELQVQFPLRGNQLDTDAEVVRLLSAWVMTVFRDPETQAFKSRYLPSILCQRCWGDTPPPKETGESDSRQQVWP